MEGTFSCSCEYVVCMTPFFFSSLDWKNIYIAPSSYILNPQLNGTSSCPLSLSLWAVRVTLGNVGNHRLNMKYWEVAPKKKKHNLFWVKVCRLIVKLQFLSGVSASCLIAELPHRGHYPRAARWRASRTLCRGWVWEEKGGRQRWSKGEAKRTNELRSGGWKGERAQQRFTDRCPTWRSSKYQSLPKHTKKKTNLLSQSLWLVWYL